ncbi:unnamed protein product [Arabidopsis halleri]
MVSRFNCLTLLPLTRLSLSLGFHRYDGGSSNTSI